MENSEFVRLSGFLSRNDRSVFSTLETNYYVLVCQDISAAAAKEIVQQIGGNDKNRAIIWKNIQETRVKYTYILIEDDHAATLAKMFADDHRLRKMSLAELRDARNDMDIPWLQPSKGYLDEIEVHDEFSAITDDIERRIRWAKQNGNAVLSEKLIKLGELVYAHFDE